VRSSTRMLLVLVVGYCGTSGTGVASEVSVPEPVWPAVYHDAAGSNFDPSEHLLAASNAVHLHRVWITPGSLVSVAPAGLFESIDNGSTPQSEYYQVVQADTATSEQYTPFTYSTEYLESPYEPESLGFWRGLLIVGGPRPPGLKALQVKTGRPVWQHPGIGTFQNAIGQTDLAVAGGFIYTVSGHCSPGCSAIIAVNAQTGRINWQHIGDRGGSGVMVASDRVYTAGTTDTYVYAARTGALLHHVPWEGLWTGDAKRAFVLASYTGPRVLAAGAGV
jgi:hypothetical protein